MNDIVVGVDESTTAQAAARTAAGIAAATGANLHIVMCVKRGSAHQLQIHGDQFRIDSVQDAEHYLHDLRKSLPYEQITAAVAFGEPAETLCDLARRLKARMIVVGNRRVQTAGRILGSIASGVAKQAPCDVLVANTVGA